MPIRSRGVTAAVVAALLCQTGCASKLSGPAPAPTAETRPALGRIGVAAVPYTYKGRLVTPAQGTWAGLVTGAYIVGYGPLLIAPIVVAIASFTAPPVAIIAGAAAGGAVLVGGIGGGLLAGSAEEVETAEAAMNKALAGGADPHPPRRAKVPCGGTNRSVECSLAATLCSDATSRISAA